MLIMMTLRDEGPDVAALELQRTVGRLTDEQKQHLSRLAGRIAEAFMEEAKPVAGIAHATLQLIWDGGQNASIRALLEMQQAGQFSLWERNTWMPAPATDQVPAEIRGDFASAYDKAIKGEWLDAAEIFARISARDTSALSLRNQGLCMAMMGENFSAVQCLRAYVSALGETEEAVDFEVLCQELEPPGDEDLIDRLQLTWPVRSADALEKALSESDHFVEFEMDAQRPDTPETKDVLTFAVLDKPKLKGDGPIDLDKVPRVVATVTMDERNASLAALDDGILDKTTDLFREAAGSAIVPSHSAGTTSSPASPDGSARLVSNTKAMRSPLPALPRFTSVISMRQFGPSVFIRVRNARRSPPTSCSATMSNRLMISAIAHSAR